MIGLGSDYTIEEPTLVPLTEHNVTYIDDMQPPTLPTSSSSNVISPICFPAGTPVLTDQGEIPIDKLIPKVHTIKNKKIVAITRTKTVQKALLCFEKDSIGRNYPNNKTVMTLEHKVYYKGKMVKARELAHLNGVYYVKYNKETLYNVLLEKQGKMVINNMIVETLNPRNILARLIVNNKLSKIEKSNIVQGLNNCIMTNNVKEYTRIFNSV